MLAEKDLISSKQEENHRFALSFLPGTLFVVLIWLISLLAYLTNANLSWLGVMPRNFFGLIGIVTSPLIHGDLLHLLSNSFPFVLLSGFILFLQKQKGIHVIVLVYVLSGLFTWFIGRQAYHIGASGVIYGMASFLLFQGFISRDREALAVSLAVLFMYSGLFYGIFPGEERVSWEGHIAGVIGGFIAAFVYGNKPLKPLVGNTNTVLQSLEQRHTSHTLGNNYNYYNIQYTLQNKQLPSKFEYTIRPAEKGKLS
jgi:membrane associated rhomboid family serine protease